MFIPLKQTQWIAQIPVCDNTETNSLALQKKKVRNIYEPMSTY